LARRATVIDSLIAKGTPFLHLDLGNFASTDQGVADFKTRALWEAMERLSVTATTPGSRELNEWPTYRELMQKGTIAVVSSNLVMKDGETRTPIGVRTKVVEINGVKVGLFGLIGGDEFAIARPPVGVEFEFLDPFQVAAQVVPELLAQSEIVVLMSSMSSDDTKRLVETVPGIDVALLGKQPQWIEDAKLAGHTITNETGIRGQYLGHLMLIVDPAGEIVDYGSLNVTLDKAVPESEEMKAIVTEAEEKAKQMQQELRDKKQSQLHDESTHEKYLGAQNCKRCHEAQYTQWDSTPHARAWATLQKDNSQANPACVGCHVTGFDEPGGFVAEASGQAELTNVQCEACHGRGTEHDRTRNQVWSPGACTTCHSGEFGKDFDFATALELVKH